MGALRGTEACLEVCSLSSPDSVSLVLGVLGARGEAACGEECQGGASWGCTFRCLQLMAMVCACMCERADNGLCGLGYAGRVLRVSV